MLPADFVQHHLDAFLQFCTSEPAASGILICQSPRLYLPSENLPRLEELFSKPGQPGPAPEQRQDWLAAVRGAIEQRLQQSAAERQIRQRYASVLRGGAWQLRRMQLHGRFQSGDHNIRVRYALPLSGYEPFLDLAALPLEWPVWEWPVRINMEVRKCVPWWEFHPLLDAAWKQGWGEQVLLWP
jgi:hypothetical protein